MRILKGLSDKGQKWIDENVHCENWQSVGGGVVGESRMIMGIGEVMVEEKLSYGKDFEITGGY